MKIELDQLGKRYLRDWVVKNVHLNLAPAGKYAITGPNGSGKSTLLRMLSGHLSPSKGSIRFSYHGKPLPIEEVYRHLAYAAPYIELIEEFTLQEAVLFHQRFRPFINQLSVQDFLQILGLEHAAHRPIMHFSSGMKQRLKLGLALCTQSSFILLDEPTTNLDQQGAAWYQQLLVQYLGDRLLVIASNVEEDYQICDQYIDILAYK